MFVKSITFGQDKMKIHVKKFGVLVHRRLVVCSTEKKLLILFIKTFYFTHWWQEPVKMFTDLLLRFDLRSNI